MKVGLYPNGAARQSASIDKLVTRSARLDRPTPASWKNTRAKADCFERNADRMRDPQFHKQRPAAGPGVIEAGCQTVFNHALPGCRLKGPFEDD